jgi:hypothetical protein
MRLRSVVYDPAPPGIVSWDQSHPDALEHTMYSRIRLTLTISALLGLACGGAAVATPSAHVIGASAVAQHQALYVQCRNPAECSVKRP